MTEEEKNSLLKKVNAIAHDVMVYSRNSLLVNLRFLDMALSMFRYVATDMCYLTTDGTHLAYDPMKIITRYKDEKEAVVRDYLHAVMHCVFCHMYVHTRVDKTIWDLACDIAVENAITELYLPCVASSREGAQKARLSTLKTKVKYMTAECLYRHLIGLDLPHQEIEKLQELFAADDHSVWYMPPEQNPFEDSNGRSDPDDGRSGGEAKDGAPQSGDNAQDGAPQSSDNAQGDASQSSDNAHGGASQSKGNDQNGDSRSRQSGGTPEQEWKDISNRIKEDLSTFSKQRGDKAGAMMQNLLALHREKYDYTEFLKKFAVLGEAMKINDDEFDYIFYTYGMQLYGKMPLIEPLEYKEVKRIREFVIAIDTSGSTSGKLVQSFLQKTYNILMQEESFFTKINLHIIQCDAQIQEDAKITCKEEFDAYLKTMTLKGMGGTDFRPVFEYVEKLRGQKEFTNLKGLIYFTDGYGAFPARQPPYHTAFVFVDDGMNSIDVPVWAIRIVLPPEEIE